MVRFPPLVYPRVRKRGQSGFARVSAFFVKQVLCQRGPELGKGVAAHPSRKAEPGAQASVAHSRLAVRPPGVGHEVVPGNTNISGVGRGQLSVCPARGESHHNYVLDPPLDRLSGGAEVPWVFSPQSAHRRLHEVAGGDASEPHPIAFAETLPMGACPRGAFRGGPEARREQAGSEAYWTDRTFDSPIQP